MTYDKIVFTTVHRKGKDTLYVVEMFKGGNLVTEYMTVHKREAMAVMDHDSTKHTEIVFNTEGVLPCE